MNTTTIKAIALCVVMALAGSGCVKKPNVNPDTGKIPSQSEYFGFDTRSNISLNINYGLSGFQALFQIYAENPLAKNDGSLKLKADVKPIYTAYTDKDGKFAATISLPAVNKEVYLYTDRWGVASCEKLDVSTGSASFDARTSKSTMTTRASSSAADIAKWFVGTTPYSLMAMPGLNYKQNDNMYASYKWGVNGSVVGQNPTTDIFVTDKVPGSNETFAAISDRAQKFLGTLEMGSERAQLLAKDATVVNITTKEAGTKLQVTYLNEVAGYKNAFGYYYYKKSKAPSIVKPEWLYEDLAAIKKYIVFPHLESGILECGTTANLKFYGELGDQPATDEFPADYTIGWFLIANGFITENNNSWLPQYAIVDGVRINNPGSNQWGTMNTSNDIKTTSNDFRRFISMYDSKSQSVVIGIEDIYMADGTPDDYCDMTFVISSNKGLTEDGKEEIPEVPDTPVEDNSIKGTLAFEDIWPYGGDYDMNDVVIEYSWKTKFDKNNNLTEMEETYTPVHDGAAIRSTFAYQLPYGTASFPAGVILETATNSVVITACVKDYQKKPVTIKRIFTSSVQKDKLLAAFNPFIIVTPDNTGQGRKEVHLPKHEPTAYADKASISSQEDAYYMKRDGKYPFAINLPVLGFKLSPERTTIDEAYPSFRRWADSGGKEDSDWYLSGVQ